MFANDLVLDAVDGTDVTYRLIKNAPEGTIRVDLTSSPADTTNFQIRHSVSGKGSAAVDRHTVTIARNYDTGTAIANKFVSFTLGGNRNTALTNADLYDLACNLIDFIASGAITTLASTANLEALVRGES